MSELQLPERRAECARCGRPVNVCYCVHITELPTRTRVVVLQHPRESHKAIGTARIAKLCLPSAEIVVGVEFAEQPRVRQLLSDPEAPAVLLYPAPGARDLRRDPPSGPVTLVVLDGTWRQSKALLRHNPWLRELPTVAFVPERPSEYRIRREPRDDYVSTIEALAQTLGLLEGDESRFSELLTPFRAMVDLQLEHIAARSDPRVRRHRRKRTVARSRLPAELTAPRLVCLMAEANAWPHDKALGGPPFPHELVHLCALRLGEQAEAFERVVAPRLPLSASPTRHARLSEAALAQGIDMPTLREAWSRFIDVERDVLCVWGHYALSLVRTEGLPLPTRVVDVRKVSGDHLKSRPGSAEDLIARLELAHEACGQGRGGERLGMVVAVTRFLVRAAQTDVSG